MKGFVLVPIFNRKKVTLKFIKSFTKQTYKDFEIVIIDDGSTDGSSVAIKKKYPKTTILLGDGNLWWTGSMRMGVDYVLSKAKDDDFILAINDDVEVKKDYLTKLVNVSTENGRVITGSMYVDSVDETIVYDLGVKIDWSKYRYFQADYDGEQKIIYNLDTLSTRGTLIPIKVLKTIGSFDRNLVHYAADYEYFFRAKKCGFDLILSTEACVYGKEPEKGRLDSENIYNFSELRERVFGIKSPYNLYNHLYLVWKYCPSLIYKFTNSILLILFNIKLFGVVCLNQFKNLF